MLGGLHLLMHNNYLTFPIKIKYYSLQFVPDGIFSCCKISTAVPSKHQ